MSSAEWEQYCLAYRNHRVAQVGHLMVGWGTHHQAGSFQFFSESLDNPVFPNTGLKNDFSFFPHSVYFEVESHVWAIGWSKKKNLSPAVYIVVFLTKGRIRQNFLQLLTNYFLLLRGVVMC